MYQKNILEKMKKVRIDSRYDLSTRNLNEIYARYYDDPFKLISASFRIGYGQGRKATRAEERKGK